MHCTTSYIISFKFLTASGAGVMIPFYTRGHCREEIILKDLIPSWWRATSPKCSSLHFALECKRVGHSGNAWKVNSSLFIDTQDQVMPANQESRHLPPMCCLRETGSHEPQACQWSHIWHWHPPLILSSSSFVSKLIVLETHHSLIQHMCP